MTETRPFFVTRMFRNLVTHDWVVIAFHSIMHLRVWLAPSGPNANLARGVSFGLFATAVFILVLTRGEIVPKGAFRAILYRIGLFAPLFFSYFELKSLLPALRPQLVDASLYHFDTTLFGQTPATYLDQFVRFETVEWFAFFYYTYFVLILFYLVGGVFFDQGKRLAEMMLAAALVVSVGHFAYTLVPGFGPHFALAFDNELVGGFWWRTVDTAVAASGAQLDIFPSLHTAFPTLFLLHAIRYRDTVPFKYGWAITAFWWVNILIATLLLRWHWAIDLMAGMTLSILAQRFSIFVAERESQKNRDGLQAIWEPIRE